MSLMNAGHQANVFDLSELYGGGVRYNTADVTLPLQVDIYAALPFVGFEVPGSTQYFAVIIVPTPIPPPVVAVPTPEPCLFLAVALVLAWGWFHGRRPVTGKNA